LIKLYKKAGCRFKKIAVFCFKELLFLIVCQNNLIYNYYIKNVKNYFLAEGVFYGKSLFRL